MSGGLAACLVLGLSTTSPAGAAPAIPPAPVAGKYTVTLITGDRVTVGSAGALTGAVHAGPGRAHVSFALSSARGHLMVIPSDAAGLIRTQRVDQRLFDVTELIKLGYDDAGRASVPLIMRSGSGTAATAMASTLTTHGARKTRDLKAVRGAAVTAPKKRIGTLWKAMAGTSTMRGGVQNVWLDGKRTISLDRSVPQIGAPAAWQAGYQGEGMSVAVLDTGVDATHPDLAGRVTSANFTTADDADHVGHGTHVASTIAGDGAASNGRYKGVAPKAAILAGKVCELESCSDSAILAGMQWAAVDKHAKVINLSLGGTDRPGTDPLEEAVDRLTAETGALFVIAAGNEGDRANTVGSPGNAASALTVGAVDGSDRLAPFSSRGPLAENGAVKPDITAPGVGIVAARAAGTEIGTPAGEYYTALDGTSMATPHVAGSAILLAQQHPDWQAGRLKATLMGAAVPQPDGNAFQQGAGRVDVARAITQTVTTQPSSVSFGLQKWPHDNDQPISRTVTYRNDGEAAVTLDLALADPAFTLDTSRVTVPAGGTAEVTVTADTRGEVAPGQHAAELTATGGGTSVVTPVGIDKETEKYELTLKHVALDGRAAPNYLTQIFQPDGDFFDLPYDPSGTVTLRVPAGRYAVGTYLDPSSDGTGEWSVLDFQPVLDITGDTTVVFDARTTTPVRQTAPEASAQAIDAGLLTRTQVGDTSVIFGNGGNDFQDLRIGRRGDPTPFTGWVSGTWVKKDTGDHGYDSPYAYFLAEEVPGETLLAGYHRTFRRAELATAEQILHPGGDGVRAFQWQDLFSRTGDLIGSAETQMPVPGARTTYFSTGAGLYWQPTTTIGVRTEFVDGNYLIGERRSYTAGRHTREEWGKAPAGTALGSGGTWFDRRGAEMQVIVPATGDAAGHPGYDFRRSTTTTLYRGDTLIASEDHFSVYVDGLPETAERYRVHQSSTGDIDGLATKIDVTMGFSSAADQAQVPVIAARATPTLGARNTAKAGRRGSIPLTVADQAGRTVTPASLTADVSFDDGKTWRKAPIAHGAAQVTYPSGQGFVSLRLHAADAAGTTFEQSVIRAYRFG